MTHSFEGVHQKWSSYSITNRVVGVPTIQNFEGESIHFFYAFIVLKTMPF